MEGINLQENLANNGRVRSIAYEAYYSMIRSLIDNRKPMELDWERFINMYNQKDDGTRGYVGGRANAYIPELKKAVKSHLANFKKAVFPIGRDPNISCEPTVPIRNLDVTRNAVKAMAMHDLTAMRFDRTAEKAATEYYLLGNGVVKAGWAKKECFELVKKGKKIVEKNKVIYNGPKATYKSIFDVYFYPEHACTIDDVTMVVERTSFDVNAIARMEKQGKIRKGFYDDIKGKGNNVREEFEARTRLQWNQGINPSDEVVPEGQKGFCVYQVWVEHDFGKGLRPYMIEFFKGMGVDGVSRIIRVPFSGVKHPYLLATLYASPMSSIYGQGLGHAVDKLQYLLNDIVNQGLDSVTFLNNPTVSVDLGLLQMNPDDLDFGPGMVVYGNKEAFNPVVLGDPQLPGVAFNAMMGIRDIIRDHTVEPSMPTSMEGKSRSATQASIVGSIAQIELIDPIKKFESDILVPLLDINHKLRKLNYDEDLYTKVLGDKIGQYRTVVTSENDFDLDFLWKWSGSEEAQSGQVRTMQLINFINVISRMPPEVQQQMKVNWSNLLMKVWVDGFGFKDDQSILIDETRGLDPETENRLIKNGIDIFVHKSDNDEQHLMAHNSLMSDLKGEQLMKMMEHLQIHEAQMRQKEEEAQAQANAMMQMQMLAQLQAQGGQGSQGGGFDRRQRSGNQTQIPQNVEDGSRGQRL